MKELIIVDLDGYMIDTDITSDNDYGVSPVYAKKVEEFLIPEETPEEETEPEEEVRVIVGYRVSIEQPRGFHLPRFELAVWNQYLEDLEVDQANIQAWYGTPEEDRSEDPPASIINYQPVFWTEGKVFDVVAQLQAAKEAKIKQMNDACNTTILAGFESSALGDPHTYDFDYEAQTNLGGMMNAITAGLISGPIPWKASSVPTPHTVDQFMALFADGLMWKNTKIQEYWVLKEQVVAATTIEEVETIAWT